MVQWAGPQQEIHACIMVKDVAHTAYSMVVFVAEHINIVHRMQDGL